MGKILTMKAEFAARKPESIRSMLKRARQFDEDALELARHAQYLRGAVANMRRKAKARK